MTTKEQMQVQRQQQERNAGVLRFAQNDKQKQTTAKTTATVKATAEFGEEAVSVEKRVSPLRCSR
ncbi:hypothetical protein [Edaphobacter aggregans]|uniref:hypothetical protein n=1 Tax=Edaphobacter aggregans TaxID=570835 RepID=UPI000F74AC56|nr:hypothetical protein [Edaphobacter aggregans]